MPQWGEGALRGMMHSPGGSRPAWRRSRGTMQRLTVAISAVLLLTGLLLAARDLESMTVGRVVVAALIVLGGLGAFGLHLREE